MVLLLGVYPDRGKAMLVLNGFKYGFMVPRLVGEGCTWVNKLSSVSEHAQVVRGKIAKELSEGRIDGPFSAPPFSNFKLSLLGIVPKKEPNEFQLIHHLSFPKKMLLHDEVDKELVSVEYASFVEVFWTSLCSG